MKKTLQSIGKGIVLMAFLGSFLLAKVSGQSFSVIGSKILTDSVELTVAKDFYIKMKNVTASDLYLSWQTISSSFPTYSTSSNWMYSICDFGSCYDSLPSTIKDMLVIPAGDTAFLKLNVKPFIITSGVAKIKFWVTGNTAINDTAEFRINSTPHYSGISDSKKSVQGFFMYPNPTNDYISLSMPDGVSQIRSASVFDILGNEVLNTNTMSKADFNHLNIAGLQRGVYIVKIQDKDGMLYSRRLYKTN